MATLTRLASTLTARYFPSQVLTDAFYMDGRLCGKRENRQADITIDKEEKGFFFSIFTHPTIQGFEPGTLPPFEPQLRNLCSDVKFGHKEIDSMIEKFLSTAVDVAGTMKLPDSEVRTPYFSGVIVKDAEVFAVTIGNGLAFLYRDDTLFPLTDAGIPMEAIDAYGNRVGDFQYYCSSKTANALWSNFFTLTPDDCIILCNKAVYDALGQREILRILTDADDQCDAAGAVITQASARIPNTPMQFSISFVESVTKEEKKGLFGFRKNKAASEDTSEIIESTVEGGVVGAAAEAVADAGFVNLDGKGPEADKSNAVKEGDGAKLFFGDETAVSGQSPVKADKIDFPGASEPIQEISAEEVMKNLFSAMQTSAEKDSNTAKAAAQAAAAAQTAGTALGSAAVSAPAQAAMTSPFVTSFGDVPENGTDAASGGNDNSNTVKMQTISQTAFTPDTSDDSPTKPVENLNSILFAQDSNGILAKAIQESRAKAEAHVQETNPEELSEEPVSEIKMPQAPEIVNEADEIVFNTDTVGLSEQKTDDAAVKASEVPFDPYGKAGAEELMDTPPLVFGDDATLAPAPAPVPSEDATELFVPEYDINEEKPVVRDEDKLNVDFPETGKVEPAKPVQTEAPAASQSDAERTQDDSFVLPFGNGVEMVEDDSISSADDIPQMPLYDGDNYDTPVNAINSQQPVNEEPKDTYTYGDYDNSILREEQTQAAPPYQPYGGEAFPQNDQQNYGAYNAQGGAAMDGNEFVNFGGDDTNNQGYTGGNGEYPQNPDQPQMPQYEQPEAEVQAQTASASSSSKLDDDWVNSILGVDDTSARNAGNAYDYEGVNGSQTQQPLDYSQQQSQYTNPGQSAYRPSGAGTGAAGTRPGGPNTSRTAQYGARSGNGGNGGKGGKRFKLNRNGYIFLAFVAVLLIFIIIVISLIAKGCSNSNANESTESTPSPVASESVVETSATDTTAAPAADTAPIGYYDFSDYIGYRTWWDLFHNVYNIDLENASDPRIGIILAYNGLSADTYTGPNTNDKLLLPPAGVITGEIASDYTTAATTAAGGDTAATTAATTAAAADGNTTTTTTVAGAITVN